MLKKDNNTFETKVENNDNATNSKCPEKTYTIKTWSAYRKTLYILSWNNRKTSPNILFDKGYRLQWSEDYTCIEVKSWKKIVEEHIQKMLQSSDKYKHIDCVYNVVHTNQSDIFLDIYVKTEE